MNRELIVNLLKKNIDDLILLTEGFEEMNVYPRALINLAQMKANDIKEYLYELGELKPDNVLVSNEPEVLVSNEIVVHEQEDLFQQNQEDSYFQEKEPQEVQADATEEEKDIMSSEEPESTNEPELELEPEPEPVPEQTTTIDSSPIVEQKPVSEQKLTLGERLAAGKSRNELHTSNDSNRLSSSLANKKIDDIRQAISLGDRFRFQRELFRANGEDMNKMLSYINMLASYEEIESFLQGKYNWNMDDPTTQDFYSIVKRKFNSN